MFLLADKQAPTEKSEGAFGSATWNEYHQEPFQVLLPSSCLL